MDELWQRYRAFWTPILIGVGVFLVGLIVVHAMTDDPEVWRTEVGTAAAAVGRQLDPARKQSVVRSNAEALAGNVTSWAGRLDQASGAEAIDFAVTSALQSAVLRGHTPEALRAAIAMPKEPASQIVLEAFGGDGLAAGRALGRYLETRLDRLNLLQTGDPNVGLARLLNDVWSELRVRANRADVDLGTDVLGFGSVSSVTRTGLPMRLLNLALIAELVDLSIRSGVRAIDDIRLDPNPDLEFGERFYREWPITIVIRGETASIRPILDRITDPDRPIPVVRLLTLEQPPRSSPLEGLAQLTATIASTVARGDASLDLQTEETR